MSDTLHHETEPKPTTAKADALVDQPVVHSPQSAPEQGAVDAFESQLAGARVLEESATEETAPASLPDRKKLPKAVRLGALVTGLVVLAGGIITAAIVTRGNASAESPATTEPSASAPATPGSSANTSGSASPSTANKGTVPLAKNEAVIINDVYTKAEGLSVDKFMALSYSDRINYASVKYGLIEPWITDQIANDPTVPDYLKPADAYLPWGASNNESVQDVVRRVEKLRIIVDYINKAGKTDPTLGGADAAKKVYLAYTPWNSTGQVNQVFETGLEGVSGVATVENDLKAIDAGEQLLRIELSPTFASKATKPAFEADKGGHCIYEKDPGTGKDTQAATLQILVDTIGKDGVRHSSWMTFEWLNPNVPKSKAILWEGMWRMGQVSTTQKDYSGNAAFVTVKNPTTGEYNCPVLQ